MSYTGMAVGLFSLFRPMITAEDGSLLVIAALVVKLSLNETMKIAGIEVPNFLGKQIDNAGSEAAGKAAEQLKEELEQNIADKVEKAEK